MKEIHMQNIKRFLAFAGVMLVVTLGATSTSADARKEKAGNAFTITCTSQLAWDIGPCYALATARCDEGKPQLIAALASTPLQANKLYLNTVQYRCENG